ncbi:MAG: peptide chain release factor N(5)-glutamine methyltransferase [Bacillota bacterium]
MNISQWLNKAGAYLAERCSGAGRVDAEVLLGHCTGRDRAALYRDGLEELSPGQEEMFRRLLERRAGGEPLAYITGHREFMGLDFLVSPAVLIPRPETELLVEKAVEILRNVRHGTEYGSLPGPVAVDVGTGSGAIAVSLAVMVGCAGVYATDISPAALEVARQNAARHGVAERVDFRQGDLLGPLKGIPGFRADLIAANLPYVPSPEIPLLMAGVRDYEPRSALDGGPDGLDQYRRLVPEAQGLLRDGGPLLVEIAPGQGAAVAGMMGSGWQVEIFRDLAGRERLVIAQKK